MTTYQGIGRLFAYDPKSTFPYVRLLNDKSMIIKAFNEMNIGHKISFSNSYISPLPYVEVVLLRYYISNSIAIRAEPSKVG